jgi:hypothetical protein
MENFLNKPPKPGGEEYYGSVKIFTETFEPVTSQSMAELAEEFEYANEYGGGKSWWDKHGLQTMLIGGIIIVFALPMLFYGSMVDSSIEFQDAAFQAIQDLGETCQQPTANTVVGTTQGIPSDTSLSAAGGAS